MDGLEGAQVRGKHTVFEKLPFFIIVELCVQRRRRHFTSKLNDILLVLSGENGGCQYQESERHD